MAEALVVETVDLQKHFGRKRAVGGLSLCVPRGSVYGFLGRNGAGKTTTIQMLMGLLQPTGGSAQVLGLDPLRDYVKVHRRATYMPEQPSLYEWMTVEQICRFASQLWPTWNQKRCLELLDRLELSPRHRISTLSRGMKGKVQLVLALAPEPELLLLDDPTSGLDAVVRREFMEGIIGALADTGATVLFSSHIIDDVERIADHIGIIDGGKLIVQSPLDDLKEKITRVTVSGGNGALTADLGHIVSREQIASERVLLVQDLVPAAVERLQQSGAEVKTGAASLEDIFVAYVTHRGEAS